MKGGVAGGGGGGGIGVPSSYPLPPVKRRWRGLAIAVLGLVFLSMLVPFLFLLGLHSTFHYSGSVSEQLTSTVLNNDLHGLEWSDASGNQSKQGQSEHVDELNERMAPTIQMVNISEPKEILARPVEEMVIRSDPSGSTSIVPKPEDLPREQHAEKTSQNANIIMFNSSDAHVGDTKILHEHELSCELRFGSYCLWRHENREDMKDAFVKKLKDRLFVARAYYPSIAKLPSQDKLSQEIKQNIQDFERILSEATSDHDLPSEIENKLQKMETVIARAKSIHVDCNNVDKKFRQLVDLIEDEASFHMKQSAFLFQLAVQTMPKTHHCLSMRLTVEYFQSPSLEEDVYLTEKFVNPTLYHCVVFSKNILAASVVINSTVSHARESQKLVFHVLTDQENYFAMRLWFSRNTYKEAAVQVMNIEDHKLEFDAQTTSQLFLPEEFRISFQNANRFSRGLSRTAYLSMFSCSHYLVPMMFGNLEKIVILDDDILVQQDLSALWSISMNGKVIGAIERCDMELGELNIYLGSRSYNRKSCLWMSGLNVVDLARWREFNLTGTFRRLAQELNTDGEVSGAVASCASLLTFQDLVYALDPTWVLSGLGHNYRLEGHAIRKASVLHYNGNMKPWLELGIPRYKRLWTRFLNREDLLLRDCNVVP